MSGVFTKSILKVGTYHSPDGVVNVTPERLKHWERETRRLQSVGYAIPSHFDHASELDLLEPIAMDVLQRGQNRSAAATVGKLESFKVLPDGKSAEITLHTLTPKASEVVGNNTVYVSPVIFPEWKDGAGNTYRDVITSFDLVDHPVDYSQTSFVPAVRMGLNKRPFLLGGLRMSTTANRPAKRRDTLARRARFQAAVRMGLDDMEKDDDVLPADPSGEDTDSAADDASPTDTLGVEPTQAPDILDSVLNLLAEYGVVLPDDTTDENIISHLRVALTALLNSEGDPAGDDESDDLLGEPGAMPTASGSDMPVASAPNIATLSVQQRALLTYAETMHKNAVGQRLQAVLKSGRCTPAEADSQQRLLQAVKLNLTKAGTPAATDVEKWIESREAVPEGTFWSDKQRTQAAQVLSVVEPRSEWTTSGGRSKSEVEQAILALGGKPN
jgi:hypothetical protein